MELVRVNVRVAVCPAFIEATENALVKPGNELTTMVAFTLLVMPGDKPLMLLLLFTNVPVVAL